MQSELVQHKERRVKKSTDVKQVDQYLPELEWAPLTNEGRVIDLFGYCLAEIDIKNGSVHCSSNLGCCFLPHSCICPFYLLFA